MDQRKMDSPGVEQLRRGDVWFVRISASTDSEMWKLMPCMVLQSDNINISGVLDTVVVVPLTSTIPGKEEQTEYDIILEPEETGLPKAVSALWTLVRTITPMRFQNKTGRVEGEKLERMVDHIGSLIGMKK